MTANNVWWFEKKPTGKDTADTIELTKSAKRRIARRFEAVISKVDVGKVNRLKEAAKILIENLPEFG